MITLTRLSGSMFALNSDLIERVDSTPDTVITLVDGTKYVVTESLHDVVGAIRAYRGAVIAESARLSAVPDHTPLQPAVQPAAQVATHPSHGPRRLVPVPDPGDTTSEES